MRNVFPAVNIFFGLTNLIAISSLSAATLFDDQIGAMFANGGYGDPVVQSFAPAQNNIAGVDVLVSGTAVLSDDVTVSLYSDEDLTNLLISESISNHPRNTTASFRWDAIPVTIDAVYYLEFITGSLGIGSFVSNTTDAYTRGDIVAAGGNTGFNFKDAVFKTYYDADFSPVPLPGAVYLLVSATFLLFAKFRRN